MTRNRDRSGEYNFHAGFPSPPGGGWRVAPGEGSAPHVTPHDIRVFSASLDARNQDKDVDARQINFAAVSSLLR